MIAFVVLVMMMMMMMMMMMWTIRVMVVRERLVLLYVFEHLIKLHSLSLYYNAREILNSNINYIHIYLSLRLSVPLFHDQMYIYTGCKVLL